MHKNSYFCASQKKKIKINQTNFMNKTYSNIFESVEKPVFVILNAVKNLRSTRFLLRRRFFAIAQNDVFEGFSTLSSLYFIK